MILPQVNRLRLVVGLVFLFACKPSGGAATGASTATASPAETAVRPADAAPDSNTTRADLARIQGSPTAPLWVIEVSDFQCPYCKQWHDQTYAAFRDEYIKTGKIRFAYVNFPLNNHKNAGPAAESAMCAGAQGKFWEMHDALFTTQSEWQSMPTPAIVFDSLAQATGVDVPRWRDCISSGRMKRLIQADYERAARAGAQVTPTFLIGDQLLAGVQSMDALRRAIDSALAKTKKTTP